MIQIRANKTYIKLINCLNSFFNSQLIESHKRNRKLTKAIGKIKNTKNRINAKVVDG